MNLLKTNRFFRLTMLSYSLNVFGSTLYNLVIITYAAQNFTSPLALSLANLTSIIPSLLSVYFAIKADEIAYKRWWLLRTGFIQGAIFSLVAFLIGDNSFYMFSIICFLNILSDILSDFENGLMLPFFQKYIPSDDLHEAYSLRQLIRFIFSLSGQAAGAYLLLLLHNHFSYLAFINAALFIMGALVLCGLRKELDVTFEVEKEEKIPFFLKIKQIYQQLRILFSETETNVLSILFSVIALNLLAGSQLPLMNFQLLKTPILNWTFSSSVLYLQVCLISAAMLSSLFSHDYFSKKSIRELLLLSAVLHTLFGVMNVFGVNPLWSGVVAFGSGYIVAKSNPKLSALMLKKLPPETLAQTGAFIDTLAVLSSPLGIGLFSIVAGFNLSVAWLLFTALAALILVALRKYL